MSKIAVISAAVSKFEPRFATRFLGFNPANPVNLNKIMVLTKKAQRIGYGTFPSFGGFRGGFNPANLVNLNKIMVQTKISNKINRKLILKLT